MYATERLIIIRVSLPHTTASPSSRYMSRKQFVTGHKNCQPLRFIPVKQYIITQVGDIPGYLYSNSAVGQYMNVAWGIPSFDTASKTVKSHKLYKTLITNYQCVHHARLCQISISYYQHDFRQENRASLSFIHHFTCSANSTSIIYSQADLVLPLNKGWNRGFILELNIGSNNFVAEKRKWVDSWVVMNEHAPAFYMHKSMLHTLNKAELIINLPHV